MKNFYLLILLFIGFAAPQNAIAQVNNLSHEATVLMGEMIAFEVTTVFPPTIKSRDDSGVIEMEQLNSDTYRIEYTPVNSFLGKFNFTIECNPVFFPPAPEYIEFDLNYIKSYVKAENDYVWYDGTTLEISPLVNDTSSIDGLTLRGITHVMYGSASSTDSSTLIYQGVDSLDLDYIVYNTIDTNGIHDAATVYVSYENVDLPTSIEKHFYISPRQMQVILLDDKDFVLQNASFIDGTLSQKADHAYEYTPSMIGVDTLIYGLGAMTRTFYVHTIEGSIDAGIVKDDVFFTAINNPITFNVLENDQSGQYFITDYSSELVSLGGGSFAYTPNTDASGIRFFSYSVDTGQGIETGEIRVIIKNFNPVNDFVYDMNVKQGTELVLDYDVPLSTYHFNLVSDPNFGTVEFFDTGNIDLSCNTLESNNSIVYTPLTTFIGTDEFEVEYCASANSDCEIVKIRVTVVSNPENDCDCINDCVWSGDANGDGKVSMLDILTVGRNLGAAGEARVENEPWNGNSAIDFENSTAYNRNAKHSDTDGNGTVDDNDFSAIYDNYGKYHKLISNDILGIQETPFYYTSSSSPMIGGQRVTLEFHLGSEIIPVVDLEGIAFSINIAEDIIDSASVQWSVNEESYFVQQSPYFTDVLQPNAGQIKVGIINTNRTAVTGFGNIGTLEFIIEDEVIGIKPGQKRITKSNFDVDLSNITITDGNGYAYQLTDRKSSVELDTVEDEENGELSIIAYPNPVHDVLNIMSSETINRINVLDITGNTVISTKATTIDVKRLESGVYIIQTITDKATTNKKIEVIR